MYQHRWAQVTCKAVNMEDRLHSSEDHSSSKAHPRHRHMEEYLHLVHNSRDEGTISLRSMVEQAQRRVDHLRKQVNQVDIHLCQAISPCYHRTSQDRAHRSSSLHISNQDPSMHLHHRSLACPSNRVSSSKGTAVHLERVHMVHHRRLSSHQPQHLNLAARFLLRRIQNSKPCCNKC